MRSEYEINSVPEYKKYDEYQRVGQNAQAREYTTYSEYQTYEKSRDNDGRSFKKKANKNKKQRALTSLSSGVVSTIAVAAYGITSLINVNMDAQFNTVDYGDGLINYEVEVQEMSEKESLTAYLYNNDELIQTINLVDDDGDGLISGSIAIDNVVEKDKASLNTYRLSLAGDVGLNVERKFDSYVIEIENKVSAFNSLSGECHCGEDGCYYFNMDYTDDEGVFDNFEAYITDSFGNISRCEFNDDLHSSQKIYVLNLKGSSGTLTLNYTANGEAKTITIDITM